MERAVSSDGTTDAYDRVGSGPTVILVDEAFSGATGAESEIEVVISSNRTWRTAGAGGHRLAWWARQSLKSALRGQARSTRDERQPHVDYARAESSTVGYAHWSTGYSSVSLIVRLRRSP
jgi:hypothetical protein